MASGYLSIETGDSIIKVCLINGKGKSARLSRAFMFRTPVGTVSDGFISDPTLLAEKLSEKLAENGMTGVRNTIFTITSGKIATREAVLPPVKENKLRALLDTNMAEYFPIDIAKYQIDYGMIRQTDDGGTKGITLTLMAAPLTIVESYVKLAREAGLIIDAIDYAGNSQFQLMKSLGSKKVAAYINVDCQYTYVTVTAGDSLIFQRMLPYGGDEYIESYRSATNEKLDYVQSLQSCCISLEDMKKLGVLTDETIEDCLSRVISGITRSMDFFGTLRVKAAIEDVILTGTCAHLAGLKETISRTIDLEQVYYLEEYPEASRLGADAAVISSYISTYSAAIAPVQLLPLQFASGGKKEKEKKHGEGINPLIAVAAALVITVIGGVLYYMEWEENNNLTRRKAELEKTISELTAKVEAVEEAHRVYLADAQKYVDLEKLVASERNNEGLVRFFEELEQKMPTDLRVLSAICTNDGVTMSIRVDSLEAAAKVLVEFRSFASLGAVDASSISESVDETGMEYYSYTVACRYYIPPEPAPDADNE